ncbi:uncharacterized protein B0I36DRAFT_331099 [Microdochium trichocladiopsis]|uniref:Ornithine cyclodeaminase n=1 Tax=Microdochium trichocladiopsis TaxID=1682393 RepID=A0A9P8Y199_9PEZI|nr:uncharacterized protein B0I36DRAFT_331099 [Microdochium trichocladiopsis]KAH7026660.1 hypothetical protein B0I36DRAFT_331099 [Microdochium trichocladiopsis]
MPPFTVLSDTDVQSILHGLTPAEAQSLATVLEDAFIEYSCHGDAQHQPHRSVTTRPIAAHPDESTTSPSTSTTTSSATSLFMPATTPRHLGVKIVGIAATASESSSSSAKSTQRDDSTQQQTKKPPPPGLKSILTLCTATGQPLGVLNAAELTGFRTALGSMLLYRLRRNTQKVVVFGAGKQAEWHIRLAVLLRGADIQEIVIVNGNKDRAKGLVDKLTGGGGKWPEGIALRVFRPNSDGSGGDGGDGLEDLVVDADVLFFTTPSKTPLFPARYLLSDRARQKTRYFGAIGSYQLDMAEIDPELIAAVGGEQGLDAPFASQVWQGQIVVDSREACVHEAGEFVKSGLSPEKWLDVGQVVTNLRAGGGFGDHQAMSTWLEDGFVIYKSVGVGIMDVAIGSELLGLAQKKVVGTTIESF